MKSTFRSVGLIVLLCSITSASPLAAVTLSVSRGPAASDVTLSWTGGSAPYQVYRSTLASNVTSPERMLVETTGGSAMDTTPAGNVFFYQIVELCVGGSCPLAEPPAAAPAEPEPGWKDGGEGGGPIHSTYLFSGEFYLSVEDLRIKGRGLDFTWARKYRSRNGSLTAMGQGWDFSYDLRVEAAGPNRVVRDGNTRADLYLIQADGTWARREMFRVLSQQIDGSYRLLFADTGRWDFRPLDGSPAQGRIASIVDRNGNALSFSYDGAGRLTSITDTLSRPITVQYDVDGYIASITDFKGRQVVYTHYHNGDPGGSAGDLASARTPIVVGTPNGNDFPSGQTTTYTYATGTGDSLRDHNLLSITDPRGATYLQNVYSPANSSGDPNYDHLTRQIWGDLGDTIDVVYVAQTPSAANNYAHVKAIVNDRMGNVGEYAYDGHNRLVIGDAYTGRAPDPDNPTTETTNRPTGQLRASDPPFFETRYEYNDDSLITRTTEPNGTVTRRVYEPEVNPTPATRSRGNLRELHRLPGALGGDQIEIVESFGYDGLTNMVTSHIDGRGNQTVHTYDGLGNRIHTQHRLPSSMEDYTYNVFGQMTTHTLPMNGSGYRRLDAYDYYSGGPQMGYLQSKRIDSLTLNLTTTYEYDQLGRITRTTDPRGYDTLFTVNALGQVVRELSREVLPGVRYETLTWYDADDNVVRTDVENRDENGILDGNTHFATMREYETLNRVVRSCQERNPVGLTPAQLTCAAFPPGTAVTAEYAYDANRNRVLVRNPVAVTGLQPANTIDTQYDERNLVFKTIRATSSPANKSTRQTDYDGNGHTVSKTDGTEDGVNPHVTTYAYDGYDRRTRTTDAMGNVTAEHYDANGNVISRRVDGQLMDVAGSAGDVRLSDVTYQYDAMDRRIRQDVTHFDTQTQSPILDGFATTQWAYADSGEVISRLDDNPGHVTTTLYDTVNRRSRMIDAKGNSTDYSYDSNSNLTQSMDTDKSDLGNPDLFYTTTYTYDPLDRLTSDRDNMGNTRQYAYDSRSNRVLYTDARNNRTRYEYDGLSRLVRTSRDMNGNAIFTDPVDIVTQQSWDDSSRLTSRTDDSFNVTVYTYDPLDRKTFTDYADCTTDVASFDVHDNPISTTDANGTTAQSSYDALDRLLNVTVTVFAPGVPGPPTGTGLETYQYDGLSRLIRASDDDSVVTRGSGGTSGYDSMGNVLRETQQVLGVGPPGTSKTITSQYDGEGNLTQIVYPPTPSRTVTYAYDVLDRVIQIGEVPAIPIADYAYVGRTRVERRNYANNTRYEPFYDVIRRFLSTTHSVIAGPQLDQRNYNWDPNSNRTFVSKLLPLPENRQYTYDAADRMIESVISSGGPSCITDYTLDGVSNRQSVAGCQDPGPYSMSPVLCEPGDLQMNQYTTTSFDNRANDKNGNLTDLSPVARHLTYDFRDRLVQYFDSGTGLTWSYKYDALGRRVYKASGGTITRFLYAGSEIAEVDAGGSTVATYVWGSGAAPVQMVRSGQKYFYHEDDQGSVVKVTGSAGSVAEGCEYKDFGKTSFFDAVGNPISQSAIGNPYGFMGLRHDQETGLDHSQATNRDTRVDRTVQRQEASTPTVTATVKPDEQVHIKDGPGTSEWAPAGTWHAKFGAAASSYWPPDLKHIAGGPRDSWFVPISYVHVAKGYDESNWISPEVFHVTEGPEKTHYVPKDWKHMETGRRKSYYLPKNFNHITEGKYASRMEYTVPGVEKPIREWEFEQPNKPDGGPKKEIQGALTFAHTFLLASYDRSSKLPDRTLFTNEAFIDGLRSKSYRSISAVAVPSDVTDARSVLSALVASLPQEVTVYPSENYYYFAFTFGEKLFKGSLSLFAYTRDRGVVDLGYMEVRDPASTVVDASALGGSGSFGARDGVRLTKLTDFRYALEVDGKTVLFNLYQPGLQPPRKAQLLPEEAFIGPSFDESGLQFFLIYNAAERHSYWLLNDDVPEPETFRALTDDVLIGRRTAFAFYVDKERNRKILIGAKAENVLQNNWYDGPFDQMPDNYVSTGQLEVKEYLERSYPGVRGRIDKYGNYLDRDGARIAVAPYIVYFAETDLTERARTCGPMPTVSARFACLTDQKFEVPKGYFDAAARRSLWEK